MKRIYALLIMLALPILGATSYLNESMQKIYKVTPASRHIPETLPEDLNPDDIRNPQNDDEGINMPRNVNGVEDWLYQIRTLNE